MDAASRSRCGPPTLRTSPCHGAWSPEHLTADGDRITLDVRMGSQFDITHHGDHIAVDRAVDVILPSIATALS